MIARQLKASPDSQILLKEYWKKLKSGGQEMEYRMDRYGTGILELAKLGDIVPGLQFYQRVRSRPYIFIPVVFHHTVNYKSIEEFHKADMVWKIKIDQSSQQ